MIDEYEMKRAYFFSAIRSKVYKKLLGTNLYYVTQWTKLTGARERYNDGSPIKLDDITISILNDILDDMQSDRGVELLNRLSIEIPDHYEDIVEWIRMGKSQKQLNDVMFKYFLKKYREEFSNIYDL